MLGIKGQALCLSIRMARWSCRAPCTVSGELCTGQIQDSVFLPTCWKHSDETLQYWKQSLCSSRTHGTGHNFSSVRKKNEITFWGLRPWFFATFGKFPWLHMKYQSTLRAKQREPNSWHTLVTPILTLAWWERQTLCQKAGKFVQVHIQKALEAQH